MKEADKIKAPRSLDEFVTITGEVKVQAAASGTQFCLKMTDYADSYKMLYQEMIDSATEVNERSGELATSMFRLHKNLEQLSELNRLIKCQSQQELFAWLSKLATGTGNFIYQTGMLVNDYLGDDYMRMHLEEADSFKELFLMRESSRNQFIKLEKALIEKKEKLFKIGDLSKWSGEKANSCFKDEKEMVELRDKLLQDKTLAFTYMLARDTQEYDQKREEMCFLTN